MKRSGQLALLMSEVSGHPAENFHLVISRNCEIGSCQKTDNTSVECWGRDPEVAGYVARGHSAGEELLCRLDFALGHLPFAASFAAELAGDFEAGTRSPGCDLKRLILGTTGFSGLIRAEVASTVGFHSLWTRADPISNLLGTENHKGIA
jgi:hypothetical protein